ncbi:Conserved_hypothetical protein [Hexamita inflata]|uniref:Uncharacterized protein n=1 Tax=Hexamita inflata TaxID=28002 RepID=A0AA86QIK2_9EUKA|nr:Conserved hypothetical protein [Hexamita inflata]
MFAITFILSELNALQSSINRITNDNFMNQLNTSQIQTCTNSKIVLGKVKMFCVRGNQTNVFVSHAASFSNTNDFNASILFDATRLDRFVYSGQISYSSQMQMFSLVSSGSLRITSSNITVSQLQCPSAALLSSRGALVLNNSAVSFSHSGQASGGLVFESLDMAVFNVAFACSITVSYGGLFAFSASGKLVLDRFSATGAFNVPSRSLVNAGSQLAITIRNASTAFFVQNRCASGSCSMSGLLVAGLDPAFSCGSNAEYCGMIQVLFGDYLQKEIVVDGVAVQARCAVEGVQDFNYSYVRVDESVSGAKANSSLFCYRPVFTRMIVSGSYQVTGSGLDVSSGSIFVASPDQLVTLQNSKVEVNFVTSGKADISVFLDQDKNTISVISSNFSITLQPNSQASFFGVSKSSKSVSVTGCRFVFSSTSLNEFCGISRSITSLQINTLLLQMNVNAFVAYGFGQISSETVSAYLVNLTGQLSGANTYGILFQSQSIVTLWNFKYSLKNLGTTQTCGFIQVISKANTVTTIAIIFSGFSGTPNIPSSFGSSSTCPCMANSNLVSGMCYCIDGASPQGNVCTCTQYSQLVGASCVCQVPETTLKNGVCQCNAVNAFITLNGTGQYACQCPTNSTNISNVCMCPTGSTLISNVCVCNTINAFPSGNTCICGQYATNSSTSCDCPVNSTLVNGVCKCNTPNAFMSNGACTCGINALNISNSCRCPTGSTLINGECKCTLANQIVSGSSCICPTGICSIRQQFQQRNHNCQSATYQDTGCCNVNTPIPICNCTTLDWFNISTSCTVPNNIKASETQQYYFNSPTGACLQTINPNSCKGKSAYPSSNSCVCYPTHCVELLYDSCRVLTYTSTWQTVGIQCQCVENSTPDP